MRTAVIGAAASGRSTPPKPVLTHHTTTGQFRIVNYDTSVIYTVSVTAGTATLTDDVITLSNPNSVVTVTARYPRGLADSAGATGERKAYTTTFVITNSYTHGWPAHSGSGGGTFSCTWSPENNYAQHYDGYTTKASTPSGYTDSYGEWWKVA